MVTVSKCKTLNDESRDTRREVIKTDPFRVLLALLCTSIEEVLSLPIDEETKDRLSELIDCMQECRNHD